MKCVFLRLIVFPISYKQLPNTIWWSWSLDLYLYSKASGVGIYDSQLPGKELPCDVIQIQIA